MGSGTESSVPVWGGVALAMCQPLAVNGPLASGLGFSPSTFNTPPTRCWRAWLPRFRGVETQRRINILSVSYVHFWPHLTLNKYFDQRAQRICGCFCDLQQHACKTDTKKIVLGADDRMRKRVWNNKKLVLDLYKYSQHQLAHAWLSRISLKYFVNLPLRVFSLSPLSVSLVISVSCRFCKSVNYRNPSVCDFLLQAGIPKPQLAARVTSVVVHTASVSELMVQRRLLWSRGRENRAN